MSVSIEDKAEALFNCKKSVLSYLVASSGRIGASDSTKTKIEKLIK